MLHITSRDAFSSAGTEGRFWTSETIHHCDAMQFLKSINALSQTNIQTVKRHPAIIHVSTSETPWSQARPAEDNWARNQRDGVSGKSFTTRFQCRRRWILHPTSGAEIRWFGMNEKDRCSVGLVKIHCTADAFFWTHPNVQCLFCRDTSS